jgi:hypothetical protein
MIGGERTLGPPTLREQELVLEALFLHERPRPRLAALVREGVAWPRVLRHAQDRAVLGTLACALLAEGLAPRLGDLAPALCAAYENATAQNAQLLHELGRIQASLCAAGIPSVALKGAALLARHYPALGARHADDLDLLVRRGTEAAAARVLRALDYAPRGGFPVDPRGRPAGLDTVPVAEHHLPMLVGPGGVPCELHVRLPGADPATPLEPIFARAVTVPFGGSSLRVAAPADLLAIACQHVVHGHGGDPRFLLRHVADLHALLATSDVRWEEARALHPGAGAALDEALRLLRDAGRPGGRERASGPARVTSFGGPRPLLLRWRVLARRLSASWRRSPADAARWFFPARAFMAARYRVAEGSALMPLLYLFRPLRGAWRLVTGR